MIPSILGDRSNLSVHSNLGDARRFHSNLSSSLKSEFVTQIWGKAVLFPQIWVTNSDLSEIKKHLLSPKHSQRNICGCRYHSHNWRSYTGSNSLFVFLHNKRLAASKLQGGISSLQARNCNELGHVHVIFRFYRRRRLSQSFRRLSDIYIIILTLYCTFPYSRSGRFIHGEQTKFWKFRTTRFRELLGITGWSYLGRTKMMTLLVFPTRHTIPDQSTNGFYFDTGVPFPNTYI